MALSRSKQLCSRFSEKNMRKWCSITKNHAEIMEVDFVGSNRICR